MGRALYRKYRSRSFDEIIGQKHITDTLKQALKQGRVSHAYLLTGPRGVGKTSVARILAYEVNSLPYTDDAANIDIIEIDAASNRRIDEIRQIREKVNIAPTSAKYKVYIIDEVHMLTKEAFNALLKTLEEPPAHVIFILATTDAHKLPDTIISRTQRFTFKPVSKADVVNHLSMLATAENIQISPDALELLAEHGEGSFRDSISLLDQASSQTSEISLDDIQQLLGIPPKTAIKKLIDTLADEPKMLMQHLEALYNQAYQPTIIAKQLSSQLREQLISGQLSLNPSSIMQLLDSLILVPTSHDPARFLELCLLKTIPQATATNTVITDSAPIQIPETDRDKPQAKHAAAATDRSLQRFDANIWPDVLSELKSKHNTLYGIVRMAEPTFRDKEIVLSFSFAFHQKRINEASNRQKIATIVKNMTDQDISIECVLDSNAKPPKPVVTTNKAADITDLSAISNIFGKAELLES